MAETKKTTTAKKTTGTNTSKTATKSTTQKSSAKSTSTKSTATKKTTTQAKKTEPAKTTSSTTQKSTTKKRRSNGGIRTWGLNKLSFYCIGAIAIFYLIASVLALCGLPATLVAALQGVATALAICIVAYNAWKYVAHKQTVWKVLYFVLLLVVLMGIVIPLIKL